MRKQCLTRAFYILAVLCFAANLLPAQDLFELKFTDKLGVKYKGLLVLFNDSKMYMRVAYNAENMYKVVNVDYNGVNRRDWTSIVLRHRLVVQHRQHGKLVLQVHHPWRIMMVGRRRVVENQS